MESAYRTPPPSYTPEEITPAGERLRLSHELHDAVGPALAGLALHLWAARQCPADSPRYRDILASAERDLRSATGEIRAIIERLWPPALQGGLLHALQDEAARTADRSGLTVQFQAPDFLPPLAPDAVLAAYRIVCEALSNAVQHSDARSIVLTVRSDTSRIEITVSDDGVGWLRASPDVASVGLGSYSMSARAAETGAVLRFEDLHPHGTRVRFTLATPADRQVSHDRVLARTRG